jgi:hypothetical protein
LWKAEDGWKYEYFEPDIDPSTIPEFASLLKIWQSKRAGRRVPAWSDFDFYDFKGWHGWLMVYEVSYDPFDYTVRLSGTNVDELYGFSTQGYNRQQMNRVYAETAVRDEFDEMTCRNLVISYITGPLNIEGKTFNRVSYLELPLSDEGERASYTIEAILPHSEATG